MPPLAVPWHSLVRRHAKIWKTAAKDVSQFIENTLASGSLKSAKVQPVLVRTSPVRPHLHSVARIRQSQSRWFTRSTSSRWAAAVRHYYTSRASSSFTSQPSQARVAYLKTSVGAAISRLFGRAPFASTLRPNLTGGALNRSAGGYSLGSGRIGGARHFSHGPANPAQVVQHVSQGLRAFLLAGHKAQFNGTTPSGEKRYRAVSCAHHDAVVKMQTLPKATPGSYIDFRVNPTITALTSLSSVPGFDLEKHSHLNTDGLLDYLSTDFSRSLKDLATILSDLQRLSSLGDLPITYHTDTLLRIHFPGCDAETVETLCTDLDIHSGIVHQDANYDLYTGTQMALAYPFAPDYPSPHDTTSPAPEQIDWRNMLSDSGSSSGSLYSTRSVSGFEDVQVPQQACDDADWSSVDCSSPRQQEWHEHTPLEYQGLEGIYRFIQQCDAAIPAR